MQAMFKDGSVMVCGGVGKDAEYRGVGDKNTPLATFGIAVGTRKNRQTGKDETIWVNCNAWFEAAAVAANIKKYDKVLAIGHITENESDGKIYKNLTCEYVSIMGKTAAPLALPTAASHQDASGLFDETEEFPDDAVPF